MVAFSLDKSDVGKRALDFLEDGQVKRMSEIVKGIGCSYSHGSWVLTELVKSGLLLASEEEVTESFLDQRGRRRFRRGRLFVRADSPLVTPNPVVKIRIERVKRFTFEPTAVERHIRFGKFEQLKKRHVTAKDVLSFFEERQIGATGEILADGLKIPRDRAKSILSNLHKRGLLSARGQFNPRLAKETPFMQENLKGFVYGRPDTDDIEKFLKSGVLSKDVNIMLNEVLKDSKQKRFTMASRFRDPPPTTSAAQRLKGLS